MKTLKLKLLSSSYKEERMRKIVLLMLIYALLVVVIPGNSICAEKNFKLLDKETFMEMESVAVPIFHLMGTTFFSPVAGLIK